jgi:hypothetical protein
MLPINLQSRCQPPWAARQIQQLRSFAMLFHKRDTFERLERPNQDTSGSSVKFARHIEHKMRAVIEIYIRVSRCQVHGTNTRSRSAEVMSGRIARGIRLNFHDPSAEAPRGQIVHHHFADQKARQPDGLVRQILAAESAEHKGSFRMQGLGHHENFLSGVPSDKSPLARGANYFLSGA